MTAGAAAGFRHRYAAWSLDAAVLLLATIALAWPKLRVAAAAMGQAWLGLWSGAGTAVAEAMMAGTPTPALARDLLHDPRLQSAAGALQSALWQLMWPLLLGYAVLGTAWHVLGVASPLQGSPGKRAFGLRVVDLQGARPRFARALGRHVAAGLSWITLNIGHLVALPSPHRALHDRIAGTRVLRDADTRRLPRTATAWIALQLLAALVLLAWLLRRYVVALDAAFG
jgi:uncharacterized RDD family membrane protein YckC